MSIAEEIINLLSLPDEFSFLGYFVASVIFVFILLQFLNFIVSLFKYIGGYR